MPGSIKTEKAAFFFLLAVLLAAGGWVLFPFLKPIFLGAILTILFYPLHRRYLVWTRGRERLASFLSVSSMVVFLLIPLSVVLTLVATQLTAVLHPPASEQSASVPELLALLKEKMVQLSARFESLAGLDMNLVPLVREKMKELAAVMARYTPAVVTETFHLGLQTFIMIIVSYYLFRDGKRFVTQGMRLSPVKDQYERNLVDEIRLTIQGVFYGNFLTALVQAVLATLGYFLAGLEAFLVWGVLTFFMAFLPMLGTGIVVVPLTFVLLLEGQIKQAVFLLIYGSIIVGGADNLLRPLLIRSNMHPLILFLSVFGGLAVFGTVGILFGPILMAVLSATLRIYAKDFA